MLRSVNRLTLHFIIIILIDLNVIYVNTFISEFVPVRLACSSLLVFLHCDFLCKEVSLLCSGQHFFFIIIIFKHRNTNQQPFV